MVGLTQNKLKVPCFHCGPFRKMKGNMFIYLFEVFMFSECLLNKYVHDGNTLTETLDMKKFDICIFFPQVLYGT